MHVYGCSFIYQLQKMIGNNYESDDCFKGRGGVDNESISRMVLDDILVDGTIEHVHISWTGLCRSSVGVSEQLGYIDNKEYWAVVNVSKGHRILSGGKIGLWNTSKTAPRIAKVVFKEKYLVDDPGFYTGESLYHIHACHAILQSMDISFSFNFLYDWKADHNEQSLGKVDTTHWYYTSLDRTNLIDIPPYDYGIKHGLLLDQLHLTDEGMWKWWQTVRGLIEV